MFAFRGVMCYHPYMGAYTRTHEIILRHLERSPADVGAVRDLVGLAWTAGRHTNIGKQAIDDAIKTAETAMRGGVATPGELGRWRDELGKAHLFKAHYNVDSYFQFLEWDRDLEQRFYLPRRPQLTPMVGGLQRILNDELDILTLSCPPGSGKSTGAIFFLSMVMGLYPDTYSLMSAHSDKLTLPIFEGVRSVITDPDYLWGRIFPGSVIEGISVKNETINLGKPHRFKTLTCRSIDGTLTGATRFNKLLIADDLVSGIEEALSIDRMNKLWEKVMNDLRSRREGDDYKEIYIATRWSVHDPIGRLERLYSDSDRFGQIVMPALDENDESNFDFMYGMGFSTKTYHDMRASMDDASWRALFMNEPIEREGLLYPEPELRTYFKLPDDPADAVIGVCDTKDKGTDYAFLPVAYVYGDDYYIEDCVCDNGSVGGVEAKMVDILLRHRVQMCRFESNAAGGRVADKVNEQVEQRGGITHITKRFTKSNKETRIITNSHWVKQRCLFKDKSRIEPRSDYATMMRLLTSYTQTGRNAVDDVPDGMAMLAEFSDRVFRKPATVLQNPLRR